MREIPPATLIDPAEQFRLHRLGVEKRLESLFRLLGALAGRRLTTRSVASISSNCSFCGGAVVIRRPDSFRGR